MSDDKSVIVSGCNGGIGTAISRELRDKGYSLIGIDKVETDNPWLSEFVRIDLVEIANIESRYKWLADELDRSIGSNKLAGLVNNAATQIIRPFAELTLRDYKMSMDSNLMAPIALTRICLNALVAAHGSVVNISSIHADLTKPNFSAYATSKGALNSLTKALAVELGDRIRVNAIAPAAIETAMLREGFEDDPEKLEDLKSFHPTKSIGTPEEIASLVLILIGSDSKFLNGSILGVDGGIRSKLHDPY